jgi:hypothetical protein
MKRNLLAAFVFLLACTMYAAAQQRGDAKSLQGLPGIRVSISWERTDPIAGDRLPGWIKMLQDQADARMKQAGIPLLKTTDQTEPAGNPLLVIHVRLSRPQPSETFVNIETKFWQTVQLSRDPTKKLDAVTWETFGVGGPEVDDKMLLNVLNSQLDRFIEAYKSVNPAAAVQR